MQRTLIRHYAAPTTGSKAKGGQAKTAIKISTGLKADMPALPFYKPLPKTGPLPNVSAIPPTSLDLNHTPTWKNKPETMLRSIDLDMRTRLDHNGRYKDLFATDAPNRIPIGSVVLVDYVSSRTQPRLQSFAGVLLEVKHAGVMTNFTLRHTVLKTGVEQKFPVFSPLITKIKVLRSAVRKDGKDAFANLSIKAVRENAKMLPIGYSRIDEMASRERETTRREAAAAEVGATV